MSASAKEKLTAIPFPELFHPPRARGLPRLLFSFHHDSFLLFCAFRFLVLPFIVQLLVGFDTKILGLCHNQASPAPSSLFLTGRSGNTLCSTTTAEPTPSPTPSEAVSFELALTLSGDDSDDVAEYEDAMVKAITKSIRMVTEDALQNFDTTLVSSTARRQRRVLQGVATVTFDVVTSLGKTG